MNRLAAFVLVVFIAVPVIAQDEDLVPRDETLFPKEFKSGYFGGPVLKAGKMGEEFALLIGARGGWIINDKAVLGAGVHYLVNSIEVQTTVPDTIAPVDTTFDMEILYGGPEFEYISGSHNLVHYTVSVLVGAGVVRYKDFECAVCEDDQDTDVDADVFFIAEPSVNVVVNVTSMFRIGLGVSYRYIHDVELKGVNDKDLRGLSGVLTARVGRF